MTPNDQDATILFANWTARSAVGQLPCLSGRVLMLRSPEVRCGLSYGMIYCTLAEDGTIGGYGVYHDPARGCVLTGVAIAVEPYRIARIGSVAPPADFATDAKWARQQVEGDLAAARAGGGR